MCVSECVCVCAGMHVCVYLCLCMCVREAIPDIMHRFSDMGRHCVYARERSADITGVVFSLLSHSASGSVI